MKSVIGCRLSSKEFNTNVALEGSSKQNYILSNTNKKV